MYPPYRHPASNQSRSGTPFVAIKDYDNGGRAEVLRYGSSAWALVGQPGFSRGE